MASWVRRVIQRIIARLSRPWSGTEEQPPRPTPFLDPGSDSVDVGPTLDPFKKYTESMDARAKR